MTYRQTSRERAGLVKQKHTVYQFIYQDAETRIRFSAVAPFIANCKQGIPTPNP